MWKEEVFFFHHLISLIFFFFFFCLFEPEFGPSFVFTSPVSFPSFQSQKNNKDGVQKALSHKQFQSALLSQGYGVLGADIPSGTCHTQQAAKPDCAKGLPGDLLVLVLVPIVLIVVGTDEEE